MFNRRFLLSGMLLSCLPLPAVARTPVRAPVSLEDGWTVADLAATGLDPEPFHEIIEAAKAGANLPNLHAVLVEHKGQLVFEQYFPGKDQNWGRPLGQVEHGPATLHDLRSVTKSVTSLLLGIALGARAEDALSSPITSFFPDRDGFGKSLQTVTLHHVLTMTAGLEWNEMEIPYTDSRNDEIRLNATDDPIGLVLARDVRDTPGKGWYYNGGLTQITAGVIEELTGKPLDAFAEEALFTPLGITDYTWHGSPAWPDTASPSAASGLRLKARDLAKIGSLLLHGGRWQGQQVVPEAWISVSTRRHVRDTPWGPPGVYGYGFFWFPGTLQNGHKVIRAVGNGDQRIFVLPDAEMAITVFAGNYNDFRWAVGEQVMARILRSLR